MAKKTIYHGSVSIIEKPVFGMGNPYNDYGLGFYCTENLELAKEWASSDSEKSGFANGYEIDLSGLKVLDLTDREYSILNWMAVLVNHRTFNLNSDISIKAKEFLTKRYLVDVSQYDVVIGYRADDSYFRFARDFLNNTISVEKLSRAMELGELGKQIVLISKKAFDALRYIESVPAEKQIYYVKRVERDRQARAAYSAVTRASSVDGEYINDIMRREEKDAN